METTWIVKEYASFLVCGEKTLAYVMRDNNPKKEFWQAFDANELNDSGTSARPIGKPGTREEASLAAQAAIENKPKLSHTRETSEQLVCSRCGLGYGYWGFNPECHEQRHTLKDYNDFHCEKCGMPTGRWPSEPECPGKGYGWGPTK